VLETQLNEGGFYQFFRGTSGTQVYPTLKALRSVGAVQHHGLLRRALDCFRQYTRYFSQDNPTFWKHLPKEIMIKWEELDEDYFDTSEELGQLAGAFILQHPQQFLYLWEKKKLSNPTG